MSELKALSDVELDFMRYKIVNRQNSNEDLDRGFSQAKLANAPTPPQALMPETKRIEELRSMANTYLDEEVFTGKTLLEALGATQGEALEALMVEVRDVLEGSELRSGVIPELERRLREDRMFDANEMLAILKGRLTNALAQAGQKRKTEGEA